MKFVSAVKKSITHIHLILSGDETSILVTDAGKIKLTEIVDETHMGTHTHIKQVSKPSCLCALVHNSVPSPAANKS
jgi:hypothetical protein